jgi:hypothetical protein
LKQKGLKLENKRRILDKIEGYLEEFYYFIRTCDKNSLSDETISEKIRFIQGLVEEYKKCFYESYQLTEKNLENEYYTNRTKTKNSFGQDLYQLSQRDPSLSMRNNYNDRLTPEGSYSNFIKFYDKTSLHNEFKVYDIIKKVLLQASTLLTRNR